MQKNGFKEHDNKGREVTNDVPMMCLLKWDE
jgi:hypothetical protein